MKILGGLMAAALALGAAVPLAAQAHAHDHTSPYAGFQDREIKALSAEEVQGLLAGEGLGMALPGELNGYPGPRHVLDMAPMLGLTSEQETAIDAIFTEMQDQARSLGATVVDLERQLDTAFADGSISEARLTELVDAIARTKAELRVAHLRAHLRMKPILTDAQRALYAQARGYGAEGPNR